MIFAIFPNEHKSQSIEIAKKITVFLKEKKSQVVTEDKYASQIGAEKISSIQPDSIDFLVPLGGDGTILRLYSEYSHLNAAIFGINLGHLGFMADIPESEIFPSLKDLLNGAYKIEERMMLEVEKKGSPPFHAVNDIVIHRSINYHLISLYVQIDDVYLNTFEADGIVIASPNGSTAYSLAAGGPILCPPLEAIGITPICPHTISNKPIIVHSDKQVKVKYLSPCKPIEVRADGLNYFELTANEEVCIRKSPRNFRLVSLPNIDYYSTLRSKLAWSGKLR